LAGDVPRPNSWHSDTFERVFERIDPRAFQICFRDWINALSEALSITHIAIDGKTLCGSGNAKLKAHAKSRQVER
jgi:hypothetical protein